MKPLDEGEFKVRCNGVPILCKGSNWVPLDALHSRDEGRYDRAMALMADMGCNIVRCWGGNVVEDHHFFNLCDELGIMVWQDFTMACANYPQQEWFFRLIEKEVTSIVMKLRNHPSILLWAGDNEVDERSLGMGFEEGNSTNEITRVVIPRVIRNHDPYRKYLPSSPYIPEGFPRYAGAEQHNWGARAYFKDDFYKHSQAHFISECGYHGCPAPESLKKFIPEDQLWPILGDDDAVSAAVPASGPASAPTNDVWDTHNTEDLQKPRRGYNRNRMMADQVRILCGSVRRIWRPSAASRRSPRQKPKSSLSSARASRSGGAPASSGGTCSTAGRRSPMRSSITTSTKSWPTPGSSACTSPSA